MTNKQHGGRRSGAGRRAGPPTKVVRLPVFRHYQLIGPAGLSRLITRNEALQTVMQCAGSTLAERRPELRAS
jgi:hypothetical protein